MSFKWLKRMEKSKDVYEKRLETGHQKAPHVHFGCRNGARDLPASGRRRRSYSMKRGKLADHVLLGSAEPSERLEREGNGSKWLL